MDRETVPEAAVEAAARRLARFLGEKEFENEETRLAHHGREGEGFRAEADRMLRAALPALYEDWASRLLGEGIEAATKVVGPVFDRGGGEIYRREIADACVRAALSSIAEPDSGGGEKRD